MYLKLKGSMEKARDLAKILEANGQGIVLDQFGNLDNPKSHYISTGPEIWKQTNGKITHFVASMGTTGQLIIIFYCFLLLDMHCFLLFIII